ncbi:paraquat-inducible protein A [Aquibium microcysteis]|uniref:paraquat-inducible protein A n=1 Tax=Aquibium microcysteis TaxID=675281 RepID=UPI00165D047B|nr:paraquat-inducible protein A [Aquibium microcysteis]
MRLAPPLLLFVATAAFALGVTLPLIRVERLYFFTEEPSLAGMVAALWQGGDPLLATIIALFSIVFPAVKLMLLHVASHSGAAAHDRLPSWLRGLSNWSMMDVVLVALVIFAAKTSGLAAAFTKPGLWCFALSVILTVAVSALLRRERSAG